MSTPHCWAAMPPGWCLMAVHSLPAMVRLLRRPPLFFTEEYDIIDCVVSVFAIERHVLRRLLCQQSEQLLEGITESSPRDQPQRRLQHRHPSYQHLAIGCLGRALDGPLQWLVCTDHPAFTGLDLAHLELELALAMGLESTPRNAAFKNRPSALGWA